MLLFIGTCKLVPARKLALIAGFQPAPLRVSIIMTWQWFIYTICSPAGPYSFYFFLLHLHALSSSCALRHHPCVAMVRITRRSYSIESLGYGPSTRMHSCGSIVLTITIDPCSLYVRCLCRAQDHCWCASYSGLFLPSEIPSTPTNLINMLQLVLSSAIPYMWWVEDLKCLVFFFLKKNKLVNCTTKRTV